MLTIIGSIIFLLMLSAFFSGSETALTATSQPLMHQLERNGNKRAQIVNRLYDQKERLIGAILLGNNLVNILASALATSLMISMFGETGVVYATIGMTVLVLIFSEILPKTYAFENSNRMALAVAPLVAALVFVVSPITMATQWLVSLTLRLIHATGTPDSMDELKEAELRGAIELHDSNQESGRHERAMLRSVLDLADVQVVEIMTHRKSTVTLDADMDPDDLIAQIVSSPYTRVPIWRGEPENVIGVLHAKALLRALRHRPAGSKKVDIVALSTKPWFIPETTNLLDQLQAFRQHRAHMALVVDEYGTYLGVVTLEDIIEEIVGDITDEHDVAVIGVRPHSAGGYEVDGTVTIRDLNRQFDWHLPDDEAATIAGLVMHESRRIPEVGQVFHFFGFRIEILRRQRNQITAIRIKKDDLLSNTKL